jgi:hypothetical protein
MNAQKVYGRKASRQYREVRTKYVPEPAFSIVLSQSINGYFLNVARMPEKLVL